MNQNITLSIGNLVLIDKVDAEYDYFQRVFHGVGGKANNFVPSAKLFMYNRLGECFSVNQIISGYQKNLFQKLKFSKEPNDRLLYRNVERLGANFDFILKRHQIFLYEENLLSETQYFDFSSSYFEGGKSDFAEYGYSRDSQPNKKQLTFGISTGINGIPTALTIQKGNVQDKAHFKFMLKTSEAVLEKNSLLVFDTGGNTKENKRLVRDKEFHYLTLKPKKVGPYKKLIEFYNQNEKINLEINAKQYSCVKLTVGNETSYIFFSEKLKEEQLAQKNRKFKRELEKNKTILKKTKEGKDIDEFLTEEGVVTTKGVLQKILTEIKNPNINGIEGFFVLESSLDVEPFKILCLYKDKDKAEKLFRNIKEGTELRPMRHWSTNAIKGYILVIFLTNFFINLTLLRTRYSDVKNLKLLKKYLRKLTLGVFYRKNGEKEEFLANISNEIISILGDFLQNYDKYPP